MRFDFSSVDDTESYVSVPEGAYDVRIAEVREGRSRDGSVRWSFRLEVITGEHLGRTAAWDSLTWSERGIYRVKKVLEALGLDVRGELEIGSNDLVGLKARVQVQSEEREDPLTGRRLLRMRVPYMGYAPLSAEAAASVAEAASGAGNPPAEVDAWKRQGESGGHAPEADDAEYPF